MPGVGPAFCEALLALDKKKYWTGHFVSAYFYQILLLHTLFFFFSFDAEIGATPAGDPVLDNREKPERVLALLLDAFCSPCLSNSYLMIF